MNWTCACGIENSNDGRKCNGCGWSLAKSEEYFLGTAKETPGEDNRLICKSCGSLGSPTPTVGNSGLTGGELMGAALFPIVGAAYSLIKQKSSFAAQKCNYCSSQELIPVSTPAGAHLLKTYHGE